MNFEILSTLQREICHFADADRVITSRSRTVYISEQQEELKIQLPGNGWMEVFAGSRLARRALRLDKCNVVPVGDDLVIVRQGLVYHYQQHGQRLTQTLRLSNCRNILHQSMAVINEASAFDDSQPELFFGEYGGNAGRLSVPVYRSQDGGRSWQVVYRFPAGKIKHVHGCYWDPVEEKVWVFTGDFAGECYLLVADRDFQQVEWIGDGGQLYRACNAFFEPETVHWIMDSQLETSYHVVLDRKTRRVERKSAFPGPVWYIKRLSDGIFLAATAQEIGAGVKDGCAHLMASEDLETWQDVWGIEHDHFPKRYFKFGVIGFADGEQSRDGFYLFFEALKGLDGKTVLCRI